MPGGDHDHDPLVLTLMLDAGTQGWLDALRRAHFPPERNLVPAHVTLFHALPGAEADSVLAVLSDECRGAAPSGVRIGPARFLGRGVALDVSAPEVAALRARLAARWRGWLSPQDRQGWRPHATVQNKVAAERARALHAELAAGLPVREGSAEGLSLWRYRGGPWEPAGRFAFAG
jgi:2'-5' RNA ligase superfamily